MHEIAELLGQLIRNQCVNFNTPESGQEHRSVAVLRSLLEGGGIELEVYEPSPGRQSLVARIAGTDRDAPSLGLMGHLDVVPTNASTWQHDPFGGELIDGYVWGRGALDMLNLTSTMAIAMRDLARASFRPRGDVVFLAVADEESGGSLGAGWLTKNASDAVVTDYLVSEWGGVPIDTPSGTKRWITVGQKGGTDFRLTVRGKSGHASMPYGSDNALLKAAKIIDRIGSRHVAPEIGDIWRTSVLAMGFDGELTAKLLDPSRIDDAIPHLSPGFAKRADACTRVTMSPTVVHGGVKSNVIPDRVEINVLVRRLPSQSYDDALGLLRDALGDLADEVEIETLMEAAPTDSPADTPLWDSIARVSSKLLPDSQCIPALTPGGNDLGFFRDKGTIAYGYGLISNAIGLEDFLNMFHGDNERVDLESLRLSKELWTELIRDFAG